MTRRRILGIELGDADIKTFFSAIRKVIIITSGIVAFGEVFSVAQGTSSILNKVEVVSGVLYGISSGVLTLISLVAIYITINSQQSIHKCREIFWNLIELPSKVIIGNNVNQSINIFSTLNSCFTIYRHIVERSVDFTDEIINLSKNALISIAAFWLSFTVILLINNKQFDSYYNLLVSISGSTILMCFLIILDKLNRITQIGKLPSYASLLDLNLEVPGVRTALLAAAALKLELLKVNNEIESNGEYWIVNVSFPVAYEAPILQAYIQTNGFKEFISLETEVIKLNTENSQGKCTIQLFEFNAPNVVSEFGVSVILVTDQIHYQIKYGEVKFYGESRLVLNPKQIVQLPGIPVPHVKDHTRGMRYEFES